MAGDSKYLEVAEGLGARLCGDAIWSGDQCNWAGDSIEFVESRWQVVTRPCGPDLYAGTPGISLFLANLYARIQTKIFKETAIGGLAYALSQLGRFDPASQFGFYSGLSGVAYVAVEMGGIFGEESLVQLGLKLLEEISRHAPRCEQSWDVVSGSAGVIPVLLKLHQRYGKEFLRDYAMRHGECLLRAANHIQEEEGWSWITTPGAATKDLTGFSHGTAGIAWVLLELHHYLPTGDERFLQAAQQAFRYERRWFDSQKENWPDFRSQDQSGKPFYAVAWCHGAPGIGLSRLRCYQLLQDHECLAEVEAALRTTTNILNMAVATGAGNYSLCHG